MLLRNRLKLLSFGFLCAGLAVAGICNATGSSATGASASRHSDVTKATLSNGLRVVIVRDELAPMVTTQITYLVGSYEAPAQFPGTAHALEHMMFRDSAGMSGAQLDEMVGKMGAKDNAFTTNDATQYYFVAPSQYLDVLLHIESARMKGAKLSEGGWRLERGAIEQEVSRDISNPGQLAFEEAERALYAGTGYAEDPLGSRPSFDKTTGTTLRKFYDQWYAPNNAILVIAGDVDPVAALTKVKALFEPIPRGNVPARVPVNLSPVEPLTIAKTAPDATGSVQYLFRMPGMQSEDYAAMNVLLDVLNNSRSELSELAVQGKVLSADAGMQPFVQGGIAQIEVGFPKGGDSKLAQGHLDNVITGLLKDGVSPDLVDAAKRQEKAKYEFSKNSAADLAESWSQALAWQGLESPEQAQAQIQAVTVDDVNRVARTYLKADQRVTVVLTPSEDGKRPPNSSGFGGTESLASDATLNAPLPTWASLELSKLEIPHWTLTPVKMTLANGLTLIVQTETMSKTVTVMGHVDQSNDLQEPKGKEGVGRLLGSLFDYGTTTLDHRAFHKELDEIAATESAGTDFKLAVPSENFSHGMELLADNELRPALPATAFAVQQKTLSHTLAGELQSPRHKMMRALAEGLLPAGDPGLREASPGSVDGLTLNDVRSYYEQVYRPDMTTIVVVGDVTPDQAKAEVEKTFGAWTAIGPKPVVVPKPIPVNPAKYSVVPNAFASQDTVIMGQAMPIDLNSSDRYALQLGNYVLGGNGFASRLMTDVRVKHGYAYTAASVMQFERSRSNFIVFYGSDPDKVPDANKLVRKNLAAMRDIPVKPDELANARQALIRAIPVEVATVNSIAKSLLTWSYKGQPLDQPIVAAQHYLSLNPQQVQAAFRKYVQPDHLVQVVQGPAPKEH